MLGILLIYFIGKSFFTLAEEFSKKRWGFAILGILSYYAGTFLAGFILGVIEELAPDSFIGHLSDIQLSFMALPFGILACWLYYKMLKRRWSDSRTVENTETLDGGFISDQNMD